MMWSFETHVTRQLHDKASLANNPVEAVDPRQVMHDRLHVSHDKVEAYLSQTAAAEEPRTGITIANSLGAEQGVHVRSALRRSRDPRLPQEMVRSLDTLGARNGVANGWQWPVAPDKSFTVWAGSRPS